MRLSKRSRNGLNHLGNAAIGAATVIPAAYFARRGGKAAFKYMRGAIKASKGRKIASFAGKSIPGIGKAPRTKRFSVRNLFRTRRGRVNARLNPSGLRTGF